VESGSWQSGARRYNWVILTTAGGALLALILIHLLLEL
jgi:hypothetical protein